ncbi:hypothetical protein BG006_006163 [Podila minutissima]|uniref:Endoplasmic reticulum-based factor for assembly of V-ATPase-domain-containing protein n=1 Tax=Podila minutissima TaxID=64525 RepID=A0A9P5VQM6_9FUNG|nr:hypothetical protein BG006_006163 [Podila minutissima]
MVNLKWTPRLEAAFHKVETLHKQHQTDLTHDETETLEQVQGHLITPQENASVDMDLVKRVSTLLLKYGRISNTEDTSDEDYIHTMIKGSSVYVPKAPPKERNPELDRIMEGIKAQVAEKEYQRMVSSINGPTNTVASHLRQDIQDLKDVKAHAIGIVNVLYTGAAVFTAVFLISKHFTDEIGKRVLLAFLGFVLIVACEAYLYSRHASASSTGDGFSRKKKNKRLPDDVVVTTRTFVSTKKSL